MKEILFCNFALLATMCGVASAYFYELGSYGMGQTYEKKYFHKKELTVR